MEAVQAFICVLTGTTTEAWQQLYTSKGGKPIRIMASPSVYAYLVSHYVAILTKAATQWRPPPLDVCLLGLDMKGILVLAISLHQQGCNHQCHSMWLCSTGKALQHIIQLHDHHISCMIVCSCAYSDMRCNPLNRKGREGKWNWRWITRMAITLDLEDGIGSHNII